MLFYVPLDSVLLIPLFFSLMTKCQYLITKRLPPKKIKMTFIMHLAQIISLELLFNQPWCFSQFCDFVKLAESHVLPATTF